MKKIQRQVIDASRARTLAHPKPSYWEAYFGARKRFMKSAWREASLLPARAAGNPLGQATFWPDFIAAVSLGTSTAKTKLGGTQVEGTSADYIVPGDARSIVAVQPVMYDITPTANQAFTATLKIESADLHLGDFEVFATAIDSTLGTASTALQDAAPWYPCNFPCNGGERMQFFGTPQVANTVAPLEGVNVLLADTPAADCTNIAPAFGTVTDFTVPYQGKIGGINYGGGPTSTGTAAAAQVFDGGLNIAAPKKLIKGVYGLLVGTTPAASKPAAGVFASTAGELVLNPLRWYAQPITGFLGTTTSSALSHLSKVEGLNVKLKSPSFVKGSFQLDLAITTLANFEVGYIYQDISELQYQ